MNFIKKNYVILAALVVILTLCIGISYAYWVYTAVQVDSNKITSDCFELTLNGSNDITINNAYPISNNEANNLIPYTFTIKNICANAMDFDIDLETQVTSSLEATYINYKLNNDEAISLASIPVKGGTTLSTSTAARTIGRGMLLGGEEKTYTLRLWVKDSATTTQTQNKYYDSKIVAVSTLNKNPYNLVIVHPNNGSETYTVNVIYGRKLGDIQDPLKDEFEFVGWYSDSELTLQVNSNTIMNSSITDIYAKYIKQGD